MKLPILIVTAILSSYSSHVSASSFPSIDEVCSKDHVESNYLAKLRIDWAFDCGYLTRQQMLRMVYSNYYVSKQDWEPLVEREKYWYPTYVNKKTYEYWHPDYMTCDLANDVVWYGFCK